jgi:hypothetical protein
MRLEDRLKVMHRGERGGDALDPLRDHPALAKPDFPMPEPRVSVMRDANDPLDASKFDERVRALRVAVLELPRPMYAREVGDPVDVNRIERKIRAAHDRRREAEAAR